MRCVAAVLLQFACSATTEGGAEVRVVALPSEVSPPIELEAADGVKVRVDAMSWTYAAVELVPCSTVLSRAVAALVPVAHAHGAGSPTRLEAPSVQSLGSDQAAVVGTLRPPAARYCELTVTVAPADDDAQGLTVNPGMLHKSFEIRGVFVSLGEVREFGGSSNVAAHVRLPLNVDLQAAPRAVVVSLGREPEGWFADMSTEELQGTALPGAALESFVASTRVRVQ